MKLHGLVLGDFHIGFQKRYGLKPTLLTNYLAGVIDRFARQHVFMLGDVFDTPTPSQEDIAAFLDLLLYCQSKDLKVDILAGNHCRSPDAFSLSLVSFLQNTADFNHVTVHEKPWFGTYATVPVQFLPWPHKEGRKGAINFAHILKNGTVLDTGKRITDAESDVDSYHWYIGDNHTPQTVKASVWPGTPYQTRKSEALPRYVVTFEATPAPLTVKTKWHDVQPPYILISEEVRTAADAKALLARLEKERRPVFGSVTYNAASGQTLPALAWPSGVEILYAAQRTQPRRRASGAASPTAPQDTSLTSAVGRLLSSKKVDPVKAARALKRLGSFEA